jgi:rubrerythrin
LLNAIANGEAEAETYLLAWADVTTRPDVERELRFIARREGDHAAAFSARIRELGFEVQPRPDPRAERRMEIATSTTLSDREKLELLGFGPREDPDAPDVFAGMFADRTIDIDTGELLGRYIAEERDTGRRLDACYRALAAEDEVAPAP